MNYDYTRLGYRGDRHAVKTLTCTNRYELKQLPLEDSSLRIRNTSISEKENENNVVLYTNQSTMNHTNVVEVLFYNHSCIHKEKTFVPKLINFIYLLVSTFKINYVF